MQRAQANTSLISHQQMLASRRILYMTHLAIGDFTYQRVLLQQVKNTYPHLAIDVWIDDCRDKPKAWHQDRNQTLVQWLESEPFINRVYPIATSNGERDDMVKNARNTDYDIVVFLAQRRSTRYARLARAIAPNGRVVGSKADASLSPFTWSAFRKLDGYFCLEPAKEANLHISEVFTRRLQQCLPLPMTPDVFSQCFGIQVPETFKLEAQRWLEQRFKGAGKGKYVLINPVSTNEKRDYQPAQVARLIELLHQKDQQIRFVISLSPANVDGYLSMLHEQADIRDVEVEVFCAQTHFYALPAMLSQCDVIITVETAVMHLCSALKKPQIVLMREQARQWQPYEACKVLYGSKRVDNIDVESVVRSFVEMYPA